VSLHVFGSKSTISRFGERYRDGQYSLVSFLFAVFILTVPTVPCGVGASVCSLFRLVDRLFSCYCFQAFCVLQFPRGHGYPLASWPCEIGLLTTRSTKVRGEFYAFFATECDLLGARQVRTNNSEPAYNLSCNLTHTETHTHTCIERATNKKNTFTV